jgi:hypothetical protein
LRDAHWAIAWFRLIRRSELVQQHGHAPGPPVSLVFTAISSEKWRQQVASLVEHAASVLILSDFTQIANEPRRAGLCP